MTIDYMSTGNRDNPVMMMLHGIGGAAESFTPQMQAFSDDFNVVAWNMPGYGKSAPLQPLSFEALAEALAELMDDIDAATSHIVGHSIGGMVAQQFVAGYPEKVSSLTLVATSAAFGGRDGDFQRRFIADRLGPLDRGASMNELATSIIDSLTGDNPDPDTIQLAYRTMAGVSEATYRANMELLVTFDLRQNLGRIHVPVLLVAGEKDTNAPPVVMEKMGTFIPDARFECIKGAGHLVNLEQPAAFNDVLRNFLYSLQT
jgi:3-oxoadipate enol-lactonase